MKAKGKCGFSSQNLTCSLDIYNKKSSVHARSIPFFVGIRSKQCSSHWRKACARSAKKSQDVNEYLQREIETRMDSLRKVKTSAGEAGRRVVYVGYSIYHQHRWDCDRLLFVLQQPRTSWRFFFWYLRHFWSFGGCDDGLWWPNESFACDNGEIQAPTKLVTTLLACTRLWCLFLCT